MPKGIIGKKIGMTRVFINGKSIPVTVIQAGPCNVAYLRNEEKDGYNAVAITFGEKKEKNTPKPLLGIFKRANIKPAKVIKEFPLKEGETLELGQEIKIEDVFEKGDLVDITGKSKGRGFTSVMKRWDFAGFPRSHGHRYHRAVGSIGCRTEPGRVWKTKRMAGHYGNETITVLGLEVVDIIPEKNVILVKGSVPGAPNSIVFLKQSAISDRRKGKLKLAKSKAMYC